MDTNCTLLLSDIFLYSYEAEFIQPLLSIRKKKLASQFNFKYRYVDDVLSINNPDFDKYLVRCIPLSLRNRHDGDQDISFLFGFTPVDREGRSAAYYPLRQTWRFQLPYQTWQTWRFQLPYHKLYVPDIPSSPAYRVFISQLIRYARVCSSYGCFILKAARLSSKLLGQGYVRERLKSSLRKFYGLYGDLIKHYEISLFQILHDILGHDRIQWHPQLIRHYTNLWTYYRTGPYNRFWPYRASLLVCPMLGCRQSLLRLSKNFTFLSSGMHIFKHSYLCTLASREHYQLFLALTFKYKSCSVGTSSICCSL